MFCYVLVEVLWFDGEEAFRRGRNSISPLRSSDISSGYLTSRSDFYQQLFTIHWQSLLLLNQLSAQPILSKSSILLLSFHKLLPVLRQFQSPPPRCSSSRNSGRCPWPRSSSGPTQLLHLTPARLFLAVAMTQAPLEPMGQPPVLNLWFLPKSTQMPCPYLPWALTSTWHGPARPQIPAPRVC
jgi:hypothetical protein